MVERSIRSVDPLAYLVNALTEFDPDVVKACKSENLVRIRELAAMGQMDMDLFICVDKGWHGSVLCVPAGGEDNGLVDLSDVIKSPFDIPSQLICWQFELCYENKELRMYKIHMAPKLFSDIRNKIHRSYYIGRFKGTSLNALQFVALRAAPHRYGVLLADCVEFAKEFCVQALAFCSNWRELKEKVHENIAKASATGFSVEKLSRNVRSSGWLGNTFLGGIEVSSWMSDRRPLLAIIAFFFLIVVCNAVVTVVLITLLK